MNNPHTHDEILQSHSDDEAFAPDRQRCQLLGPTALVVQALMGILVLLSLVYKRHRETSKRPWRIWSFDVSKQIFGQMFIHGVNLLISGVGAHGASRNPCALYFINVLVDTTLGVGIIYAVHHGLTYLCVKALHLTGCSSGYYGKPPKLSYWARQAMIYVVALTSMKILVVAFFTFCPDVIGVGEWLLSPFGRSMQVVFVMGLFPIVMNIIQFWLIDSIVKATSHEIESGPMSSPRLSLDREPLFSAAISDDGFGDEDCNGTHAHDIENPACLRTKTQSIEITASTILEDGKPGRARRDSETTLLSHEGEQYPPSGHVLRSRSVTPRSQQFAISRNVSTSDLHASPPLLEAAPDLHGSPSHRTESPTLIANSPDSNANESNSDEGDKRGKDW